MKSSQVPLVRRALRACVAALLLASAPLAASAQSSLEIVVASPPNDSSGPIFYAAELGLYEKAGLNVKVQALNNPGAIAAAVASGSVQIGSLTVPSVAVARQRGVPLVVIGPGAVYSKAAPTSGIIVLKNSPFKKASDLNGKTIATRDLSNLSYYGANYWIDKNGGDAKSLKWVEITDTNTVPALVAGRIDAASVSEPALDNAIHGSDARMFAPVYDALGDTFMIAVEFASADFTKAHPDIVRKFNDVMIAANTWGNRHREQSAKIVEKYGGVAIAPNATRVSYAERLRPADMQPVLDMLQRFGVIPETKAADLIAPELGIR